MSQLRLPKGWRNLTFGIQWRRRSLQISIDPDKQIVEAIVEAGETMVLFVGGEPNQISSAATIVIPIRSPVMNRNDDEPESIERRRC